MFPYCWDVHRTNVLEGGDPTFPQLTASPHSMDSMLPSGEGNYVPLGYWGSKLLITGYLTVKCSGYPVVVFCGADLEMLSPSGKRGHCPPTGDVVNVCGFSCNHLEPLFPCALFLLVAWEL